MWCANVHSQGNKFRALKVWGDCVKTALCLETTFVKLQEMVHL